MITGPVVEMLARNKYFHHTHQIYRALLTLSSKFAETYQSPPPLLELIKPMRASGAGVVVLSCSDPRLNPYQVLGIDGKTLSELSQPYFLHHDRTILTEV
jgi:carbonic anhydrase